MPSVPTITPPVGPERVIEKIKDGVNSKKLQGISDVIDLTDRNNGLKLVIELKTGFDPNTVLELLYRFTPLEESFSINNVALVEGRPETLDLRDLLGVSSNRWLAGIELVDGLVRDFVSQLPRNTGLVVTSDHGVIDVAEHEKIYFDEIIPEEQVRFVGGDTRGLMVYLKNPEQRSQLMESLNTAVGNDCYLV